MRNLVFLFCSALLFVCCSQRELTQNKPIQIHKIAFGSCGDQRKPQPVLRKIVKREPDLFIYLGDNIYSDTYVMDTLRHSYAVLSRKPEFIALKSHTPIIATWDDHDYGANDAGRHYPFKRESKQIFMQFFGVQDSSLLTHDGIYFSKMFSFGDRRVHIILPDLRTFRDKLLPYNGNRDRDKGFDYELDYSPYTTPDSTMLGKAQWKWIEEELKVPADITIIASSTQFGITHNGYEAWANFPHEQKKMLDLIKKAKTPGVIFISGDVHYAEISKLKVDGLYPIYDVTASGITSKWDFATPNENRVDGPVMENHFGMITIDWDEADPTIHLRIYDVRNHERIHRKIKLSELQF